MIRLSIKLLALWAAPFVMVALFYSCAHAEGFRGVMALAAMHPKFPCDVVLKTLDNAQKPAMGVLYGTFGTDETCIQKFTERYADRPHFLNIYFENSTARRNRKMYAGEWLPGYSVTELNRALSEGRPEVLRSLERRLSRVTRIGRHFTKNTFAVLTIGLEDNYSSSAWRRLAAHASRVWPWAISRNSVNDLANYAPGAYGVERHVSSTARCIRGRACIVSNDGTQLLPHELALFFKRNGRADVILAWEPKLQGRKAISAHKFSFKPPRLRTFSFDVGTRRTLSKILKYGPR